MFESNRCKELKEYKFSFANTLMIDSELDKIRDYPKNSVLLKPYEAVDVLNPTEDQSKILLTVRDYVFEILEDTKTVPEYIESNPP